MLPIFQKALWLNYSGKKNFIDTRARTHRVSEPRLCCEANEPNEPADPTERITAVSQIFKVLFDRYPSHLE